MAQQLAEFEAICAGNLSPDNSTRQKAEAALTQLSTQNPGMFMLALLALLKESKHALAREFAAVILRQHLLINSSSQVWSQCTPDIHKQIQNGLLYLFQTESNPVLRRKITDAVAATATRIGGISVTSVATDAQGLARTKGLLDRGEKIELQPATATPWPELMPLVIQLAQANAQETRESLCDLIEKLAKFIPLILQQHLASCKAIVVCGMRDTPMSTRLTGLRACVAMLDDMGEQNLEHMKDTVPLMFEILGAAFAARDNETIVHAVTALSNLLEIHEDTKHSAGVALGVKFLRGHVQPILTAMVQMTRSTNLDAETRRVCLSFLLTMSEEGKGLIRKQQEFAKEVISLAFSFLTELQHTSQWENPDPKIEDGDEDDAFQNYLFGGEAMDRLANSLGGKVFLSIAEPAIVEALKNQLWNVRHAALVTISKMAQGCAKHLEPKLEIVMKNFVLPFALNDPHPRVRYAAINVLAHLAEAFEPDFSNTFSVQIFQTLLACMNPQTSHWRVIANACLAIPDICRYSLDQEKLVPHMQSIFTALIPLLSMLQYRKVVEGALSAVSAIAAVAEHAFIPYYDSFMPGVKSLIMTCTDAKLSDVRKKAIECIGMIAQAVKKEKFRPELETVMNALLTMLQPTSQPPLNDAQRAEVITSCARICRCVGTDFVPYLPHILPPLLASAKIHDAVVVVNEGDLNEYKGREGWETQSCDVKHIGTQSISKNDARLEEKALSIRMLFEYTNTLGGAYLPYVKETADILVPMIRYQFNENVRDNAVLSMPPLMRCIKEGLAADVAQQQQKCMELLTFMWDELIKALIVEPELECLNDIAGAVRDVIELMPVSISQEMIQQINVTLFRLVQELLVRCSKRDEARRAEDFDDAQAELFELENGVEDEFLGTMYGVINALVKNGRDAYLMSFHQNLYEIFNAMMISEDMSLRTSGICVISQVIEDCPTNPIVAGYCNNLFKICVESVQEEDDIPLRQSAVFGLGVCSIVLKAAYASQASQVMTTFHNIITSKDLGEDHAVVTDNAISGMAKVFHYTYNNGVVNAAAGYPHACPANIVEMMRHWIDFLPCDGDLLEAQKIHEQLCQFIMTNNAIIIGHEFSNLPKILGVFGKILAKEDWEDVCTPETRQRIIGIWQQLQRGMPEERVRAMFQAMNQEQKGAFGPYLVNPAIAQ